jgi:hypothetical protein
MNNTSHNADVADLPQTRRSWRALAKDYAPLLAGVSLLWLLFRIEDGVIALIAGCR